MTVMYFLEYKLLKLKYTFIVKVVPKKNASAEKIEDHIEEIHGPIDDDVKKTLKRKDSKFEHISLLNAKEKEMSH